MPPTTPPPPPALPPGPRSPSWWQLVRFAGDPLGLLDECHRRYGDAFTLHVAGNGRFVMLSDPETVRDVFRGDPDVLHSGEANSLFTATVGRHSVLVLDGAAHARQRRVVVPPLKGERMRAFFDAMRLETLEAVRRNRLGVNHEESEPGVTAIGASIGWIDGQHAALTTVLPTVRLATVDLETVTTHLLQVCADVRQAFGDNRDTKTAR